MEGGISLRGSFFERSRSPRSKVKFMCVFFSDCSPTSPRSLGRSSPSLMGRLRAAPYISSRGSLFKGKGHRGQRSNFCISTVLGPICMKLGECIQVDPCLRFMGPIGSKVIEVKGQIYVCFFFLLVSLPGPWADLHQTSTGYRMQPRYTKTSTGQIRRTPRFDLRANPISNFYK